MKKCATYSRYSSDLQLPTSIEDQVRLCEQYAERQGWTVVATYHDAAISGATTERPGYQELVRAALSTPPAFDLILCEALDRLTRDPAETSTLYRRLRLHGVDIVGVSDGTDTSRKGATLHIAVNGLKNALFLEDLSDKTHRGLSGLVARGLSAGGRIFGYRAVPVSDANRSPHEPATSARFEIHPPEAEVVRQIFRDYAHGQSSRMIAYALNRERVAFPSQNTKRGPGRRGWAISSVRAILRNEKYAGVWTWNRSRFLRDPESGRRRAVPRPPEEWDVAKRPELVIVEPALWTAVQARFQEIREHYGAGQRRPPRNGARPAYSPHLLSDLLRCGVCTGRMWAETVRRATTYTCGVARAKGPAICIHRTRYEQPRLEEALIVKFREAMTPLMVSTLVDLVNERIDRIAGEWDTTRGEAVKAELVRLERKVANLVGFVAQGDTSPAIREELRVKEQALEGLRREHAQHEQLGPRGGLRVHRAWVERRLEHLDELLRGDGRRARLEIAKHLDGPLTVTPLPAVAGQRRAEISGQVRSDSLLAGQAEQGVLRSVVNCGGWI